MSRDSFSFSSFIFRNNPNIQYIQHPSGLNDNLTQYISNPSNQNNLIDNSSKNENSSSGFIPEETIAHLLIPRSLQHSTSIYQAPSNMNTIY